MRTLENVQREAAPEARAPRPESGVAPGGASSFESLDAAERLGPRFERIAVRSSAADAAPARVHQAARHGVRGAGGPLPHAAAIKRAFGGHDLSTVRAHTDRAAARGAAAMGASAFTVGDRIAFAGAPDLRTAAHEAAHVIQQRSGVALPAGVGAAGDAYERHADLVAEATVAGRDAAPLFAALPRGGAPAGPAVQRVIIDNANGEEIRDFDLDHLTPQQAELLYEQIQERRVWSCDPADMRKIIVARGRPKRAHKPASTFNTEDVYAQKRGNMSSSQQSAMEHFVKHGAIGAKYSAGHAGDSDDEGGVQDMQVVNYAPSARKSLYQKGASPLDQIADKSGLSSSAQDTTAVAVSRDQRTLYVAHQQGKAFRKAVELATDLGPSDEMPEYDIVPCDEFGVGGLHAEMQIIYYCLVKGIALGSIHAMGVAGGKGTCEMCSYVLAHLGIGFSFIQASHYHHLWQDPFQLAGKKPPFNYPKQ